MELYTQGAPKLEIERRISKLQNLLSEQNISGALVLQKSDFFYFSGTLQQGWLYVPAQGKPLLMIFKDYERAKAESPIDSILSIISPKEIPEILRDMGYKNPAAIGMELDVVPTNLYFQYKGIFKDSEIRDISIGIRLIRAIKSDYEIEKISEAAAMSDKVAAKVPELLECGKSEVEIAGELESFARSLGHQGIVRMRLWGSEIFYGHIMSGAAAAVPSYMASPTGGYGTGVATSQGAGFTKIGKNEPILVDYVFALNGYLSDHARIFSIGHVADEFLKAHDAMLTVQQVAIEAGIPGMATGQLYDIMVQKAKELGYDDYFMGSGDRKIRFTGHGIGLELDEFPFIANGQTFELQEGMTLALEPKAIMPQKGVVGIENTFVVTKNGLKSLAHYPQNITVI
ncbi:MAG: aminopeptidase P family protein [Desulfamplus sp.]|nr:aminopeptidase P family protein [Desulfamplus sp.]